MSFQTSKQLLEYLGQKIDDDSVLQTIETFLEAKDKEFENQQSDLEKFRLILDMTPCTISWIKNDLTYAGVNQFLADICQMKPEEFIGQKVGFHTKYTYFTEFTEELFKEEQDFFQKEIETIIDGMDKKFLVVGAKFNKQSEAIVIGVDITEVSNLRDSVAFMDKLSSLGEMVAGIVHEVNNPLTVVSTKAQQIPKYLEREKPEKILEAADAITRTSKKISHIIHGVKTFVRRGDEDPLTEVDIHEVVQDAVLICESKLKEKEVAIHVPGGPGCLIKINVTQIFQVIVNLLTNGIDAIEELPQRWVKILVEDLGDRVKIILIDSGNGIPEEAQEKIWTSFYTTKAVGKGTGLGLPLCKKIVEKHNGTIEIINSEPHTTFHIILPKT